MSLDLSLSESRYDRQERITWWDQERLAEARVLVVGAGALGNELVKNLVLVGVGSIVVIDFDTIEMSNLSRCVFFREEDEGQPKAATLARRAMELNPSVEVVGLDRNLLQFGTGVALRADVMAGALDSREARLVVNRLAWRTGRAWVDGAIEALTGVARVFSPPESCYECTLSETDLEIMRHRQSCRLLSHDDLIQGKVPTTATTSSVVAGLQAQEVVKLIHREREGVAPLPGGAIFDGANNDIYVLRYPFDEDCLSHDTYAEPIELAPDDSTTFADVSAAAGLDEALVELSDDYLTGWNCTSCGKTEDARGVVSLLTFDDAACPTCGEPRQPQTTTAIEIPGPLSEEPVQAFSLRDDEVLPVRRGMDYRYVWLKQPDAGLPESWS